MAPLTLEGDTLGEKRRHYNELVEDAIANKHYKLRNISADDSDIDNLLKIDVACKTRNVDYIIEVMKSNDMLYAATAIKKSTWLITEQQYANIINPEYLHTQLLPSMNTKTFNKLMLHIRLNLKDESRVETFYEYMKKSDGAYKWLQYCSIPFIENVIKNERLIPVSLFKRLCRRSAHFITYYTRCTPGGIYAAKQEILFLLKSNTEEVMKILEQDTNHYCPQLGKKKTELLMKKFPQKVINDFEKYVYGLDLAVVARYLKKKEIKSFLYEQAQKDFAHYICNYEKLEYFVKNMPDEERFEFIKKIFIDKTEQTTFYSDSRNCSLNSHIKPYQWYEFAPFDEAFAELKKLIRNENSSSERCAMLSVLIICARKNLQHCKTLLTYFKERHINEPIKFKILFFNNLLSQISAHEFDVETWNVLDQLFHSMEVYTEAGSNVQLCLQSIVLYKVLHEEPVPEIVEQKITFNTFDKIQKELSQDQNSKLFTYLLHSVLRKVQIENVSNETDFSETMVLLNNVLTLLKDWKKDISKYPNILEKIQQLIRIRQEKTWKTDMSCLYNVKKSWRKHMFEESLSLCLSEEACLNALKHKPQLLTRHDKQIDKLRTDDAVSLPRLLAKLRVFWSHSLAQHWVDTYLLNLNKPTGQKAVIKGLFALLHQHQIIDMAKKYKPDEIKVNWGDTDQNEISIRKNIAKHLHKARPQIPLDVVLWYAKGDYLQHAVPSLNAILPNLNESECREYLPKLLDAPVSLQKFGLNLAVSKLTSDDLKSMFSKIWKTSKNLTIRSALFKHTYDQMRKATNARLEKELWEILSSFIDNLTAQENPEIYKKFGNVQHIPISIRGEFYMKSYEFLITLPASANCESYLKDLIRYAPTIMDNLDENFVVSKMLSPAGSKFCSYGSEVIEVFACYVLCGKTEEEQLQRFRRVVEPAIDEAFHMWGATRSGDYYIKDNFKKFLSFLNCNFRIYYLTKKTLPVKLFLEIKTKMEKELPMLENYVLYTSWKLITEYVTLMEEHKAMLSDIFETSNFITPNYDYMWMTNDKLCVWKDIHSKIAPSLGPLIVNCFKEDSERYNIPTIYSLFTNAFEKMFDGLSFKDEDFVLETLQHMLNDHDFIPSYILVSKATPKNVYLWTKQKIRSDIRKKLESHPSKAVRMHYYNDFQKLVEDHNLSDEEDLLQAKSAI